MDTDIGIDFHNETIDCCVCWLHTDNPAARTSTGPGEFTLLCFDEIYDYNDYAI